MRSFLYPKKIHNSKIVQFILICFLLFITAVLIFGCSKYRVNGKSHTSGFTTAKSTELDGIHTNETKNLPTYTSTPSQTLVIPTKTMDPIYDLQKTIDVTQESPNFVSTPNPEDSKYLYKSTIVSLKLVDQFDAIGYLNLDNLDDNSKTNSDIEIERTIGNLSTYSLYPINGAYDYYSNESAINLEACEKYFPLKEVPILDYYRQVAYFTNGGSYCILTNEGRIAIVKYVPDSIKVIDNFVEELSVDITVYKEKVE